jgi:hypothetical protein
MIRHALRQVRSAVLASATAALLPSLARGAIQTATWTGGAGTWSDATKWSTGAVPNNTVNDQYDVAIDGSNVANSSVTFSGTATVNNLSVDAGDSLALGGSSQLTAAGSVTLNGDLSLVFGAVARTDSSLAGNGNVNLNSASFLPTGSSFTVGSGITAHGLGTFGSFSRPMINSGHIVADAFNDTLNLRANGLTNAGTIEAKNGGLLTVSGTFTPAALDTIVNHGGTLQISWHIASATVNLTGSTFTNGAVNDWRIGDGAHFIGGTLDSLPGHDLFVAPSVPTPNVTLDGVTLNGNLDAGGALLLIPNGITGTGRIRATNNVTSINDGSTGLPLIIGAGITIHGSADIGGTRTAIAYDTFIHGTVEADIPGNSTNLFDDISCDGTLSILNGCVMGTAGTVSLAGGGHLHVELGGPLAQASFQGHLDLTGDDYLDLTQLTPGSGPYLIVGQLGTFTGVFDHVTPGYTVDYSQPGKIYVSPIPEPSSVVAIGASALAALGRRRRVRTRA